MSSVTNQPESALADPRERFSIVVATHDDGGLINGCDQMWNRRVPGAGGLLDPAYQLGWGLRVQVIFRRCMDRIRESNAVRLPIAESGGAIIAQRHKVAALHQRMLDQQRCYADDGGQAQVALLIPAQRLPQGRRHPIAGNQIRCLGARPICKVGLNVLIPLAIACTVSAKMKGGRANGLQQSRLQGNACHALP